jgi:nucleotide-binding universal stress UspA family protein
MEALAVVVGLDGSDGSLAALAAAARLAALTGYRIVVVHVVRAHPLATAAPVSGAGALAAVDDEVTDRCHMDCEVVLAGTDVLWQFEVRHGDPVTELARAAADHDAICVTIGRSIRRRFTCGSRSTMNERLVHRCDRPVLIVPPEPERAAPHEPS